MGMSSDGILAYGYELKGPDEWRDEPEWYDAKQGFRGSATDRIIEGSALELDATLSAWERRKTALEGLGLGLESFGYCEYDGGYLLSARRFEAWGYGTKAIESFDLPPDADVNLKWAMEALGYTDFGEPKWILTSSYG